MTDLYRGKGLKSLNSPSYYSFTDISLADIQMETDTVEKTLQITHGVRIYVIKSNPH